MSKPFQFSMRRLVVAVAWLCLAAWLASRLRLFHPVSADWNGFFILASMAVGASIGTLFFRSVAAVGCLMLGAGGIGFIATLIHITEWTAENCP